MRIDLVDLIRRLREEVGIAWAADLNEAVDPVDMYQLGRLLTRSALAMTLDVMSDCLERVRGERGVLVEVNVGLVALGGGCLDTPVRLAPALDPAAGMDADTLGLGWPRPAAAAVAADPLLPGIN